MMMIGRKGINIHKWKQINKWKERMEGNKLNTSLLHVSVAQCVPSRILLKSKEARRAHQIQSHP